MELRFMEEVEVSWFKSVTICFVALINLAYK